MKKSFILFVLSSAVGSSAFAAAGAVAPRPVDNTPSSSYSPHVALWKSDLNPSSSDHLADLPPLMSPVDNALPDERAGGNAPQSVPVEAVPTPTAVNSGLLVLGGLAAVRLYRRLKMAQ